MIMNNFLIEANDNILLKEKINELIIKNNFNNVEVNNYDIEEEELVNALEDLDTYGLFSEKKVVIINNIESLNIDNYSNQFKHLLKYLNDSNENNLLIITSKKLNNTKKLTKELKKRVEFITPTLNIKDYIKKELKDYKISSGVINEIASSSDEDITKIYNECQKLKNYKFNEKEITAEDVHILVIKKQKDITNLTFEFVRKLAQKDKKEALIIYKELEENNIEPIQLLGLIASQIRIIYQVKLLSKKNLSDEEITNTLGEKSSYRIKKTKELINFYSEKELLNLMKKLSDIDLKIKTTDVDSKFLIELLILNI